MAKQRTASGQLLLVQKTGFTTSETSSIRYFIDQAAERAGVPRRVWLRYWRWGLADSQGVVDSNQRRFDEEAVYRVRRAEHIRRRMDTDLRAAATIVQLLERVERLERELDFYR